MIGFPDQTSGTLPPRWVRRRESPVFARNGMVAAAHPLIATAGIGALQAGGNAVDAAVCAALVASVVMPEMCGLGGDLFAVVSTPGNHGRSGSGEPLAIHGSGIAPRGLTIEQMRERGDGDGTKMPSDGPLAVAVPGMVDACFTLLDRFGTKPFCELAALAVRHAADGFPLSPCGARRIAEEAHRLARFPTSAAVFLPGGDPPLAGAMLRQPDLARTLRQLAEGGTAAFYRGEIGQHIGRFLAAMGGTLAADDLADHRTEVTTPLVTTYRGYRIYETGLPTHGLIVLESLNIVEQADMAALGIDTAAGIHMLVEAKKRAFADRLAYAGDPAFVDTPLASLLSKAWAEQRFASLDGEKASQEVPAGDDAMARGSTTYLCAADGDGMMVSLILSIASHFGSGVVAGDTGIVLNNRAAGFSLEDGHPNVFAPGKKPMHTLNCFLVADQDGTPLIVGGTPGADGQPQWNLQVLTALIDAGLDVQAAVEAPRWGSWPGARRTSVTDPFELAVEDRLGNEVIAELAQLGHRIRRVGAWEGGGGSGGGAVQVIARDPETGVLVGGSDPRAEGMAVGR